MGRRQKSRRPADSNESLAARPRHEPAASYAGAESRLLVPVICGLLLLAVGLVYVQTVRHEFINCDDDRYVYENPQVSRGLSREGMVWAAGERVGYWGPLTWISLMLDAQVYGLSAGGYHLSNLLLHAVTTILLFLVLRAMTGQLWPGAMAAALFAVHPLRAESVAWVTERKDVLSGLFFMSTLGAYVWYVRRPFSLGRYLLLAAVFTLGLMVKPMLVTLPLVLLLLDYWPLHRFAGLRSNGAPPLQWGGFSRGASVLQALLGRFPVGWQLLLEKLPLLAPVAVVCAFTLMSQREALASFRSLPMGWRLGNALVSYAAYIGQFFYPVGLAVMRPRSIDLPTWKIFAALLVLVGITAAAWIGRRRFPYLLVGWFWYLGMLLPMSGVVQFGIQAVADRFTYLPQIGLAIALAWAAGDACRAGPHVRRLCGVAAVLLLAIVMGCAWRQTVFWQDSETLWNHTLLCTSGSALAHYNLAAVLLHRGQLDEAKRHYQQALKYKPDYVEAYVNLGIVLASQGRFDEALVQYGKALKIKPDSADAHTNLGVVLAAQGRLDEAAQHYRQALKADPDCAEAYNNLGSLLGRQRKYDEALALFQRALAIKPDFAQARENLDRALAHLHRLEEAGSHAPPALETPPRRQSP